MFVTELSDAEIVLGKFMARFASIVALVFAAVPVMAIVGLLGGIIPEALVILTIVTLAVSLLGCALAMALSVRASKTHEVLMVVFAIWSVWLLSLPLWAGHGTFQVVPVPPAWFFKLNPFVLAYAPYVWPGYVAAMTWRSSWRRPGRLGRLDSLHDPLPCAANSRLLAQESPRIRAWRHGSMQTSSPGGPARRWTATPSSGASGTATGPRACRGWSACSS